MSDNTNAQDLTVLVVDDNKVIRELVTRQLAKLGLPAETAISGIDALEKLAVRDYEIVLMDVQMPDMDGLQATEAIRKKEEASGKHTKIIALTGHGSRVECIAAGMDDFIAKPMNIATLRSTLQKWIPDVVLAG